MENKLFALHTAHTSYLMQADAQGRLLHLYYGPRTDTAPAIASPHNDPGCHPNLLPQEWPCPGIGDNHAPFFEPEFADGTAAAALKVVDSCRTPGLPKLPGLPAFWDGDETLTIVLEDAAGLRVELHYGVIAACDLLLRWATLTNTGSSPLTLRGVPSAVLDFRREDLDFLTLDGEWGAERTPHRAALRPGVQSVSSVCGLPSHFHNPFAVLCEPDADEEQGGCWGAALVYSGNFRIQAEQNRGSARLSLGVEPYHFAWTLAPGEQFTTPQAAFVFSDRGLGGMSRAFHEAIRSHLIRGRWRDAAVPRPVLLNSWEACYFTFDEAKLLELAAAKQAGADLFVLDDGWFKGRNDDATSLGDWTADSRKLPGGIPALCQKVNELGLEFGIWVEPEAVNPDSDLFRAHPDWIHRRPGMEPMQQRNQYMLNLGLPQVEAFALDMLRELLTRYEISYLKWDMNRSMTDVCEQLTPFAREKHVLAVYRILEALRREFPAVDVEACSGGGARVDLGMIARTAQFWPSDNTDPFERLLIQEGASLVYSPAFTSCWVTDTPASAHRSGRNDLRYKFHVAMCGSLGVGANIARFTDGEIALCAEEIARYKALRHLVQEGDLYRLLSPSRSELAAVEYCAKDGSEAVMLCFLHSQRYGCAMPRIPLRGLRVDARYLCEETGRTYSGSTLMHLGLQPDLRGDFDSQVIHLKAV